MDISGAFNLLERYNLKEEAKYECKERKIDEAPYDMAGHHKVYSELLGREWLKLRDKRDARLNELQINIIDKCDDEKLKCIIDAMKEIEEAQDVFKKVADNDYSLR